MGRWSYGFVLCYLLVSVGLTGCIDVDGSHDAKTALDTAADPPTLVDLAPSPGNLTAVEGDTLEISARCENPGGGDVGLFWRHDPNPNVTGPERGPDRPGEDGLVHVSINLTPEGSHTVEMWCKNIHLRTSHRAMWNVTVEPPGPQGANGHGSLTDLAGDLEAPVQDAIPGRVA